MDTNQQNQEYPKTYGQQTIVTARNLRLIAHFDFEGLMDHPASASKEPVPSVGGLDVFAHSRSTAARIVNDLMGAPHPPVMESGSPFEGGVGAYSLGGAEQRWLNLLHTGGTPLLKGAQEFVVSMDVKYFGNSTKNSWLFCASRNQRLNVYMHENYIGIYFNSDGVPSVERYSNGREGATELTAGLGYHDWVQCALVIRPNSTAIYVNGTLAAGIDTTDAKRFSLPSIFGPDGGYTYFGKGNWGYENSYFGEFFDGLIDNIRIYAK